LNRSPGNRRHSSRKSSEPRERKDPSPGTITAISSQANDPERVSVFIDGDFAMGLARDVSDAANLYVGQELSASDLASLQVSEQLARATSAALNYLAWRPRSEGEVRQRLRRSDTPADVIDKVVEKLRDWRYIDDEDFARRWIENRAAHRPRGTRVLTQELRAKGIDPELASTTVDEAEIDEASDALELARKRYGQLSDLEPDVRERRLTGFLARRGYGFDIIRSVIETLRTEPEASLDQE
jgi:regulatory protein